MSKDPAFLFYSNDFLSGTFLMNNEQVGKYIRLLCLQHQKGNLSKKDMINICKTYDEDIFNKFTIDKDGNYFNIRLNEEFEKRRAYSESRSINRKGKKKKKTSKTYVKHMEDENENKDVVMNEDKNEKSLHQILKEIFEEFYNKDREENYEYYWEGKDGKALSYLIPKLKKLCKGKEDKVPDTFRAMLEKNNDKWINDNLSVSIINSKFNEIVRKIKGSTDPRIEEIKRKFDVS